MKKYKVYRRYYMECEDAENDFSEDWEFVGETKAVSSKKAINNVRYRKMEEISQYKPLCISGHWENGYKWKAEESEREE